MRQLERRAYVWQVDELVEAGRFKKFPDKGLIAVLVPEVKITSIRKQKIRKKFKGKMERNTIETIYENTQQ